MANVPVDPSIGHGEFSKLKPKVQKALEANLAPGETVRCIIRGAHAQAMIGTESRVFVIKPGFMAGATFGVEATSWSYTNLIGVQVHKGLMSGSVLLQAAGQTAKNTSYWGQGKDDPAKAPNAIPVVGEWDHVQAGAALLRQLIDDAHAPRSSKPVDAPTSRLIADELRKLVELRSEGVLTEDEFESAKARLLAD